MWGGWEGEGGGWVLRYSKNGDMWTWGVRTDRGFGEKEFRGSYSNFGRGLVFAGTFGFVRSEFLVFLFL